MYYVGQLAYFELNLEEIIQKYCINKDKPELQCNGKCHLANTLNETSNGANENSKSLKVALDSFLPVFLSKQEPVNFSGIFSYIEKEELFSYSNNYSFLSTSNAYKPPIP